MTTKETTSEQPGTGETAPGQGGSRITSEARGLVDDVKTWVDLKLQLLQLDVEDRIENALNRVVFAVIFGVLGFMTLLFVLLTLAFGLGALWYSDTLGFLAVTVLLLVATAAFRAMRPSLVSLRNLKEKEKEAISAPKQAPGLPAPPVDANADKQPDPAKV